MILAGLPAADGMAALLLDRLKQRLVRTGEARGLCACGRFEGESSLCRKPFDAPSAKRSGAKWCGPPVLEQVEQEAVRWVLAISAYSCSPTSGPSISLRFGGGRRFWQPAEAGITLLVGGAWRLFETGLAVTRARRGRGASRARTVRHCCAPWPAGHHGGRLMSALDPGAQHRAASGQRRRRRHQSVSARRPWSRLFSGASYLIETSFALATTQGECQGHGERITFPQWRCAIRTGIISAFSTLGSVRNNSRTGSSTSSRSRCR